MDRETYCKNYMSSFHELGELLKTKPRSATALKECKDTRTMAKTSGRCPNCNKELRWISEFGTCIDCTRIYDRMLASKSKIINGYQIGTLALERLADYYANAKYVPYSLRGSAEDSQEIVDKINDVLYWRCKHNGDSEGAMKYAGFKM